MGREPTDLLRYSHLGFQFALILVGFIFGGYQLDRRLSTGGIITLLGTFVGAGVAFYVLYRETRRAAEDPGDSSSNDPGTGSSDRHSDRNSGGS
jgi:hypothetical protein